MKFLADIGKIYLTDVVFTFNSLHWVKDVIYEEDISPQKAGFAPRNLSLLKTWVLTVLRTHGFESMKSAISEISHNIGYLLSFCT